MQDQPRFKSFIQAGFECSSQRLRSGRRVDLIAATRHDVFARQDYRSLLAQGIHTVREGLRWHLIERDRGRYDFESMIPLLDAADELGVEQIIDLFHFGWPDHIEIFSADFVDSFCAMAWQFARLLRRRGVLKPYIAPMNEISFVSWGGGDVGYLNPFVHGRGNELKRQLVRAGVSAAKVFRDELPQAQFVWPEPVIHIAANPDIPGNEEQAEHYRLSMFEAWDMVGGYRDPELGGSPELLNMIGINFYDRNQWMNHGRTLWRHDPLYRPFHKILQEVWSRYHAPMFVSETGTEDSDRPEWFAYVAEEVRQALYGGVPVEGICLYPILNHPGWDDERHCLNGLFDYCDAQGERQIYEPLAVEIARQRFLNSSVYSG